MAIEAGNQELIQFLLEKGAYFGPSGYDRRNLLFAAASKRDWKTVDWLLAHGLTWEADRNGTTPLHVAVYEGNLAAVQELVKRKVSINAKNKDQNTPLHDAIWNNNTQIIKFLRENGATE